VLLAFLPRLVLSVLQAHPQAIVNTTSGEATSGAVKNLIAAMGRLCTLSHLLVAASQPRETLGNAGMVETPMEIILGAHTAAGVALGIAARNLLILRNFERVREKQWGSRLQIFFADFLVREVS